MAKSSTLSAGIDTGKRQLDVALAGRPERLRVDNTAAGHAKLAAWLRGRRVRRVGIEACGGYETAVVAQLRAARSRSSCSSRRRCAPTPCSICNGPRTTPSTRR